MSDNKEIKTVETAQKVAVSKKKDKKSFVGRVWAAIRSGAISVWNWIKTWNVMWVLNAILLLLVILMFLMFLQIMSWNKQPVVQSPQQVSRSTTASYQRVSQPVKVIKEKTTATMETNTQTGVTVISLPLKKLPVNSTPNRARRDVVVDRNSSVILKPMTAVRGNLYIQNMNTYTLPCGMQIDGHLIVRNVKYLKFCGCFDIKGNIYVDPNSSFGAIPAQAKLGGQVIM